MMFGLSEILKRDWRGKSQGQNCGMVFLKSIYGVRVFCQWLYINLIYSFIQCELFCRCIHFLLWGVTVLQAKRPHLLVVMPAFLCAKQLKGYVHWSITTYLFALFQIFPTSLPVPLGGERHCGSKKGVSAWNTTTWRSNVGHAQEINYCRLYANFPPKSQWKTRKQ